MVVWLEFRQRCAAAAVVIGLFVSACSAFGIGELVDEDAAATTSITSPTTSTSSTTSPPQFLLNGTVLGVGGAPLDDAVVSVGAIEFVTDDDGVFMFESVTSRLVTIDRPAYRQQTVEWDGTAASLDVTLEPVVARALRAAGAALKDLTAFAGLLALAEATSVDALVFDTKQENGTVRYDTNVEEAHAIGAVRHSYDPADLVERAHSAGLYAITRVAAFADPIRAAARPDLRLTDKWVDMTNRRSWNYLLDLTVEACELGFDEIQFDYVRFPVGEEEATAALASRRLTVSYRVGLIVEFLTQARELAHPLGCAIGADVFGVVLTLPDDVGLGQRPEEFSGVVDVMSPMIYPAYYPDGWFGLENPKEQNAEVTASALSDGLARIGGGTIVRPWLQAFSYTDDQIREGIDAAEERDLGWMLWQIRGEYNRGALPTFVPDPTIRHQLPTP